MIPTRLAEGYRSYRRARLPGERQRLAQLAVRGQTPYAMIIGCCDSRAAPETVFNAPAGELFVLRNVANIVPPYAPDGEHHGTSSAIEFAVLGLLVPHIVVMGHSLCGGIAAFLSSDYDPEARGQFIGRWMNIVAGARKAALDGGADPDDRPALQRAVEEAAIRLSLDNLRTFPAIRERADDGRLALHGTHYDIATGELRALDPAGRFVPVLADGDI